MKENIKINCHSSICINDKIYFDPFQIHEKRNNAEVIFITHSHFDHLDVESINNIRNDKTKIVCTKDSAKILRENKIPNDLYVIKPFDSGKADTIEFKTSPSYTSHHLKKMGFVGYTAKIDGVTYTVCGDTDATKELEEVKTDILLIPIGGFYTMDAVEAAKVTNIIKPKLVIPTHYNFISGTATKEAEKDFIKNVDKEIEVKILI